MLTPAKPSASESVCRPSRCVSHFDKIRRRHGAPSSAGIDRRRIHLPACISCILCISLISRDALLVFVPAWGRSARWIRLLSAGAPLASNREDHEFKKFVKGAKKTVMEKALATVEESQVKEKGDGGQESQVGGATASTAAASANTVPSATTNADAIPNGNAAAVPAEIDNAIAPSKESTG